MTRENIWKKIAFMAPPPMLKPRITFFNELREPAQSTFLTGLWKTQISKAVSAEEASTLTKKDFWTFVELQDRWIGNMEGHEVDDTISNALLYGWDFASDIDRQSYNNRGRTFRMVRAEAILATNSGHASLPTLPLELWDVIVSNLPPPPPNVTPIMSFCNELREPTQSTFMTGMWATQISKAISIEEATILTKTKLVDNPDRWVCKLAGRGVDETVSNALLYGWDFASDIDRQSYENRGRMFRMVKK